MIQAIIFGAVNGLSLIVGAFTGTFLNLNQKTIARIMAFGSGVLICTVAIALMEEAFERGGFDAVTVGLILGGITFLAADYIIHLRGGRKHRRKPLLDPQYDSNGKVILVGSALDGLPESIALGIALFSSHSQSFLVLSAIVLSNFPEGIASIKGLKKEGYSSKKIFLFWGAVAFLVFTFTVLSYAFLNDINPNTIGIIQAFAAGAILCMLADSMIPEAYEEAGFTVGFLTLLGFLSAFILERI